VGGDGGTRRGAAALGKATHGAAEHGKAQHAAAFAASAWRTGRLLARGDLRTPPEHVGHWLTFADGTRSQVYRETVRVRATTRDPALLVVAFELPLIGAVAEPADRWWRLRKAIA